MTRQGYIKQNRERWIAAIAEAAPATESSKVWREVDEIASVLQLFVGEQMNHTMLPTGGGQDVAEVHPSIEPGCLELRISRKRIYIVRPERLTLERIDGEEAESFLLLELANLKPSGVYEDMGEGLREELLEVGLGYYFDRAHLDYGYLDHDENGDEMPIPDDYRLVVRWLNGKLLFVAKASIWNQHSATYDARHNRMSASRIREIIERSLAAAEIGESSD